MADSESRDEATPAVAALPGPLNVARWVFAAFLATFTVTRCVVFLIMSKRIPDLYLYIGGTHVHHLNYGIFLLSGIGGYLLFAQPGGRRRFVVSLLYGVGLALTFDEFGMWLHLGGGYWQRASFAAVAIVGGLLCLMSIAPVLRGLLPRRATLGAFLIAPVMLIVDLLRMLRRSPSLERIEDGGQ